MDVYDRGFKDGLEGLLDETCQNSNPTYLRGAARGLLLRAKRIEGSLYPITRFRESKRPLLVFVGLNPASMRRDPAESLPNLSMIEESSHYEHEEAIH